MLTPSCASLSPRARPFPLRVQLQWRWQEPGEASSRVGAVQLEREEDGATALWRMQRLLAASYALLQVRRGAGAALQSAAGPRPPPAAARRLCGPCTSLLPPTLHPPHHPPPTTPTPSGQGRVNAVVGDNERLQGQVERLNRELQGHAAQRQAKEQELFEKARGGGGRGAGGCNRCCGGWGDKGGGWRPLFELALGLGSS
jgi:hypothetical protein